MTIAFRASGHAAINGGVTSFVISKPSGTAQRDILFLVVDYYDTTSIGGAGVLLNTPAGWTLLSTDNSGGFSRYYVFYKIAGASEPSTYTITSTGPISGTSGTGGTAGIIGYSGNALTIDSVQSPNTVVSTNIMLVGSLTTTNAGLLVLLSAGMNENGWGWGLSNLTGFSIRVNNTDNVYNGVVIADIANPTIGNTGTFQINTGANPTDGYGLLVQLYEAATSGNTLFFGTNA